VSALRTRQTAVVRWMFGVFAPDTRRTRILLAAAARFAALSVADVCAGTGAALEAVHGVEASDAGEARPVLAGLSRTALAAVAHVAARTLAADGTVLGVLALRPLEAGRRVVAAHGPSWPRRCFKANFRTRLLYVQFEPRNIL